MRASDTKAVENIPAKFRKTERYLNTHVTKMPKLYLIKFSLFSTVVSKSLCCNVVEFRV